MDNKGKNRSTAFRRHQFFKHREKTRKIVKDIWEYNNDNRFTDEDIELIVTRMEKNRKKCSCSLCQHEPGFKHSEVKQLKAMDYMERNDEKDAEDDMEELLDFIANAMDYDWDDDIPVEEQEYFDNMLGKNY